MTMADALTQLLELLDVEPLDRDLFRGHNIEHEPGGRLFGGLIAAQALRAAQRTADADHTVHSLHSYFMRPGRQGMPVILHVDRIRDGRSFATRRVVAVQQGQAIFTMAASFQRPEPGAEYAIAPAADTPAPDDAAHHPTPFDGYHGRMSLEIIELMPFDAAPDGAGTTRRAWVRTNGPLPDDPSLHACVLAYMSDFAAVFASAKAVPVDPARIMVASLDHALWFHRPIRLDEWVLVDQRPVSNSSSRGLVTGSMHSQDGVLGASVAQEALIRQLE